ncbi:MAG: Ca-activated chloride channel family protein, partial [Myxococcota bacterium]
VRVAIRYKQPGASEDDAAAEVAASLLPSDVPTTLEDTDADMKWAAAVAATAEVVKGSPYVTDQTLLTAGKIIKGYEGGDADRLEFKALFQALETLLAMAD